MDFEDYDLIVFGVDNTLRTAIGSDYKGRPLPTPNKIDEWILLGGVRSTFRALRKTIEDREESDAPLSVAFVANQGGVEYEYLTYKQARNLVKACVIEAFDGDFPRFFVEVCPVNDEEDPQRLPNSGMIEDMITQTNGEASRTIVIGGPEMEQAALGIGSTFVPADSFFGR